MGLKRWRSSLSCHYFVPYPFLPCSNGRHESHEGHESWKVCNGHDSDSRVQVSGRIFWLEDLGGERSDGGLNGNRRRRIEKDRLVQDRRHAESEAEDEESHTSAEGREPIHEGTLRL